MCAGFWVFGLVQRTQDTLCRVTSNRLGNSNSAQYRIVRREVHFISKFQHQIRLFVLDWSSPSNAKYRASASFIQPTGGKVASKGEGAKKGSRSSLHYRKPAEDVAMGDLGAWSRIGQPLDAHNQPNCARHFSILTAGYEACGTAKPLLQPNL